MSNYNYFSHVGYGIVPVKPMGVAKIDISDHAADALAYALGAGNPVTLPPPPDPSWPQEQQDAHQALFKP